MNKPISKISFTRDNMLEKTTVSVKPTEGNAKSFTLNDEDMIQLEDTLNLYNINFIKNDNSPAYSKT